MRHFASVFMVLATASLAGCAFEDGQPWGQGEVELTVALPVPASRDVDGAIKTSSDYLVRLDDVQVQIDAVTLRFSQGDDAPLSFDPADPPPGYGLCHGGHCHADDGRLVDYADIEAELSGGEAGAAVAVLGGAVALQAGLEVALPLGECADGCALPRGTLVLAEADVSVQLSGLVGDARTGAATRLGQPIPFQVALGPTQAQVVLAEPVDRGEPVGLRLKLVLTLPASLFDGVEWVGPPDATVLAENLASDLILTAEVARFDP
jgi:hypothetical protein